MLQMLPRIGRALRPLRSGPARLALSELNADPRNGFIAVQSAAFHDGAPLPVRCTTDGQGVSPSLQWRGVPPAGAAVILMIEDIDSPTPQPLVHAIVWGLPGRDGALPEGALSDPGAPGHGSAPGDNSTYSHTRYRPPDPPRGTGPHRYAFEVLALDVAPQLAGAPERGDVIAAARGHVVGAGCLIGTYARR